MIKDFLPPGDHDGRELGAFGIYDFAAITGTNGSVVTVRNSPIAEESCVWLFCLRGAQLNVEQAKRLRDALQRFIDGAAKEALGG